MAPERVFHPDCINASNPYHECVEYCFLKIAASKSHSINQDSESAQTSKSDAGPDSETAHRDVEPREEDLLYQEIGDGGGDDEPQSEGEPEVDVASLTGRQKKLFELRLKMNEARKANQTAMVAEKRKKEAPEEARGISKQKWLDQRKKKIGKILDANGLDMSKAYMLDTQQAAEVKYKKWEKDPAPAGWDVFNQKTLYKAHKKRANAIDADLNEYNKMKAADPEFYREASSLQYGKAPKTSEDKIERMVKELNEKDEKRRAFSRRRRFHEEKDVDSINDRNEHFNKKIERAFGKYTLEIKNNLERGTALPD